MTVDILYYERIILPKPYLLIYIMIYDIQYMYIATLSHQILKRLYFLGVLDKNFNVSDRTSPRMQMGSFLGYAQNDNRI